ncbi:MAG: SDR family oxidoreductase [Litoreibacter sp.]|uniref:SDR family oxidoreductase n=1 Tax=Litoreibacter sp. TaxID=1969459 RepID=UPI00329A27F1
MTAEAKNVLILGAYGLIGSAIARHLARAGHRVTGLGRNPATAQKVLPNVPWRIADMAALTSAQDWPAHLSDADVVINCTGALQDGPQDDLEAVHHHALKALSLACAAHDVQLVQISAIGATLDAATNFMASKARGDAAIKASGCHHQILRPGLVLSDTAYGGTAMLRMLAAVPLIQPLAFADAPIQTVSTTDIARAVEAAVSGQVPNGFEGDLVEPDARPLAEIIASMRHWLGFAKATKTVAIPPVISRGMTKCADALSHLGWRSPLRSNAVRVLQGGVTGDPIPWRALGLAPISSLEETLRAMPARAEDRLSARISLVMPMLVATLSLFWLLSGLIGLAQANTAAEVLQDVGWPYPLAVLSVVFWAIVDIALGLGILIRKHAPKACWAMIAVSLFYLGASTLFTPHLWADPLGPLVKVLPAIALTLVTRITLETR